MKHFAKKREMIRAVQWTGEMTPDVVEMLGDRKTCFHGDRQLRLGDGWYACVGDWICTVTVGRGIAVLSDEVFRKVYEEVDAADETAGRIRLALSLDEVDLVGAAVCRDRDRILDARDGYKWTRLLTDQEQAGVPAHQEILRKLEEALPVRRDDALKTLPKEGP
jgi:hypothetical protein